MAPMVSAGEEDRDAGGHGSEGKSQGRITGSGGVPRDSFPRQNRPEHGWQCPTDGQAFYGARRQYFPKGRDKSGLATGRRK